MVSLWLISLLGLVFGASTSPALTLENASCGKTVIFHDFLKPLKRMVPVHKPPASGKLPFGPKGLRLGVESGLIVGRGSIGFSIDDEAFEQRRRLNWIVTTTLAKVDGKGVTLKEFDTKRRRLASVQGNRIQPFVHEVSGAPAYYRVDIHFSRMGTHQPLARYSTYARVMRPKVDFRVAAETPTVVPGEVARATLTNFGTVPIVSVAYDYGFDVQAFTGERWIRMPENPKRGPVPKRMQYLPPGGKNHGCLRYLVPADQAPGLFRFVARSPGGGLLAAEFEVVDGLPG